MKELAMRATDTAVVGVDELVAGLTDLGLEAGDTLIVHCAMSAFGLVAGGEQTVVEALRIAVGHMGTLVMPSQSWQLCDPDFLDDPALDAEERERVRMRLPAFDPDLTPTRTMGRVAELFRVQPGARRSPHPHRSFAALGPEAAVLVGEHERHDPFGERSPLARLYDARAKVVLLGVGYESCTALHLAETRAAQGRRPLVRNGAPLRIEGRRDWVSWLEPVVDDRPFGQVGAEFDASGAVRQVRIGSALCRAMEFVALVDFAQQRFSRLDREIATTAN